MALVTLIDGRQVLSSSHEWALECLARNILAKPLPQRRMWLDDFEAKHGAAAVDRLREAMSAVHAAQRRVA